MIPQKRRVFLTVCVLLLAILVSCTGKGPDTGTTESVTNADSQASRSQLDLAQFSIITPSSAGKTITLAAKDLKAAFSDTFGKDIDINKDNIQDDTGGFEILIGVTNREISETVLNSLEANEYAVVFDQKKIVLIGKDDALTKNAVEAFISRYVTNHAESTLLSLSDAEIRMVWAKDTFSIIENGKSDYKIIYPRGNRDCELIAADLAKDIKLYTNVTIFASDDITLPGENVRDSHEILIGMCDREECRELKDRLAVNQYGLFHSGNKLCVFGWNATTINSACDLLSSDVKLHYSSQSGLYEIESDLETLKTNTSWNISLPAFPTELTACFDPGDDQLQFYYTDTTLEHYGTYLATLTENGYTREYENILHENYFSCYRNNEKNNIIYISYTPCDGVTRVTSAKASAVRGIDASKQTGYQIIAETSLTQVPVPCIVQAGGQCYIVTLEDGSFIINDGGGNENGENENHNPEKLYNALKALNKRTDGKIHIAAWIVTHEHWDHFDNFYEFVLKYKDELEIECMLYQSVSAFSAYYSDSANDFFNSLFNEVSRAVGGITRVRVHTGQTYMIRNCKIEVLYTPEDLFPIPLEKFNDSSVVYRLYLNGKTAMIVGDAQEDSGRILVNRYREYLKSDYGQVVHHGFWGAEYSLYEYMRPSVLLWPQTVARANNLVSSSPSAESYKRRNYSLLHNDFVTAVYYADGDPVTFTFSSP